MVRGGVKNYFKQQDLSTGPLAAETTPLSNGVSTIIIGQQSPSTIRRLNAVFVHGGAPFSQRIEIIYVSPLGPNYDTLIVACTVNNAQNFAFLPEADFMLHPLAGIRVTCTNTGSPAAIIYAQILLEEY
jgi:hypothetical protein